MKGQSNIISGVHNLRQAHEQFSSFQREYPGSKGASIFGGYKKNIQRIVLDLITIPSLTDEVRDGVRAEWNSDVFVVPAIAEKVSLLSPDQRERIEAAIDKMLDGKQIRFEEI